MRVSKWILPALAVATDAFGTIVPSSSETINPATASQVITLAHRTEPGSSDLTVRVVVADHGMSTDVSPRYSVYLAIASYAEMGNITATFPVIPGAYQFVSATRVRGGVYKIVTKNFGDHGIDTIVTTVDATQAFRDEKAARGQCGDNFCDLELQSEVRVDEVSTLTQ